MSRGTVCKLFFAYLTSQMCVSVDRRRGRGAHTADWPGLVTRVGGLGGHPQSGMDCGRDTRRQPIPAPRPAGIEAPRCSARDRSSASLPPFPLAPGSFPRTAACRRMARWTHRRSSDGQPGGSPCGRVDLARCCPDGPRSGADERRRKFHLEDGTIRPMASVHHVRC